MCFFSSAFNFPENTEGERERKTVIVCKSLLNLCDEMIEGIGKVR